MAKLIFGCGYLGRRVARLWRESGETVYAVTRTSDKARQLASEGLTPMVADITTSDSLARTAQLSEIDTVLFAVGLDRGGKQSIREVYIDGLERTLKSLPEAICRIIYISSTGVYGQVAGDVVDESSPCQPTREGGQACLAAEQLLQQSKFAHRAIILRLAGIYGPERIPRANDLASGAAIPAPSQGWLNLIHVDDAARIVLLAETRSIPPQLFCVSDGQPVQRADYYTELARLLHAPPPQFVDPPLDSPAALRAASDKRVSNALLMRQLGPTFLYPSYREGLAAIVASGKSP